MQMTLYDLNKQIIGEVIKEDFVVDVFGNIQGYLNALGDVIALADEFAEVGCMTSFLTYKYGNDLMIIQLKN